MHVSLYENSSCPPLASSPTNAASGCAAAKPAPLPSPPTSSTVGTSVYPVPRAPAASATSASEPTLARSPEVKLVRDEMDRTGVAICLDVHGDEALPYNFIAGAEGIPGWTDRQHGLHDTFCDAYVAASPDFQRAHGYPVDAPGAANMTMCTSAVAARFSCLAMTLEMPFKDNADLPDSGVGWSPERAMRLGAASLDAFGRTLGEL